jgi:hypothetical protein
MELEYPDPMNEWLGLTAGFERPTCPNKGLGNHSPVASACEEEGVR